MCVRGANTARRGTGLRTRVSGRVRASVTVISAEERIEGVVYNGGTSRSLNASTTCTTATIPSLRKPIHPVCPLRWMKACWDRIASAHLVQIADFGLLDLGASMLETV